MDEGTKEIAKTTGKAIDGARDLGGFIAKYTGASIEQAMGILEDRLKYMRWVWIGTHLLLWGES